MSHTPTPWRYSTNIGPTQAIIVEEDGSTILDLRTTIGKRSELEANARFIVRACNAHDDLVKALRSILAAHDTGNNGAGEAALCRAFANLARAALAKAEAL